MDTKYLLRLCIEAAVVGLLTIAFGTASGFVVQKIMPKSTVSDACRGWNDDHRMELALFITGASLHLVLEAIGVNSWYCKNATKWPLPFEGK